MRLKPPDLIAVARLLVSRRGKPPQAHLRRAVSTAYYAVFHALARDAADLLVGGDGSVRSRPAWCQLYRALEHGRAKEACRDKKILDRFPDEVQQLGRLFVTLQEKRHRADYDPAARFTKSDVTNDIALAEAAIADFRSATPKDRRAFCVLVLFQRRP